MAEVELKPVRGKDRGKLMKKLGDWTAPIVVGEFADDLKLLYLPDPKDLALLGNLMHHCSGTHFVWACEERIWYFFALVDKNGVPHATLHTKELKWLNKPHPRENMPRLPAIRNADGWGYPSLDDFLKSKTPGFKYEQGKLSPSMNSRMYDINPRTAVDYYARGWDRMFRNPIAHRPDGVPPELFNEYMRCWKAMQDHYDKKAGAIKIVARTFYFDAKKQIVLSLSGGAQVGVKLNIREPIFEWLNQHQKKDEAVKIG